MYPPVHKKAPDPCSFDRLTMLWERYPQYHEKKTFADLDALLEEHPSWQEDFDGLRTEYEDGRYEEFLIQLSWADLPYRMATGKLLASRGPFAENPYVRSFMDQFRDLDTDHKACFLFPESYTSRFFVITEICRKAERFYPVRSLFPDEEKIHYLVVFDKQDMDTVLLMFHLLYTNPSRDLFGGYSLYEYPFSWYQSHLREDDTVLRSPYLPDRIARYQGVLPFHHNPAKTVYVRRNISHILECGYFSCELEFFLALTKVIMPHFQWWYDDLAAYEDKDGYRTDWRLERTRIRTQLTAEGIIKPKWKQELSLFHIVREQYPDTLYQYRPAWLGRQSLDLFIPSLQTAIEYQGIQHYQPVGFFGGEEALLQRRGLDEQKKALCDKNGVRLIEWPYSTDPTADNLEILIRSRTKTDHDLSLPAQKEALLVSAHP